MEYQIQLHQGGVEREAALPQSAGHALCNAPHSFIGLVGHKGTLLAQGQPVIQIDLDCENNNNKKFKQHFSPFPRPNFAPYPPRILSSAGNGKRIALSPSLPLWAAPSSSHTALLEWDPATANSPSRAPCFCGDPYSHNSFKKCPPAVVWARAE